MRKLLLVLAITLSGCGFHWSWESGKPCGDHRWVKTVSTFRYVARPENTMTMGWGWMDSWTCERCGLTVLANPMVNRK